MDETLNRVKYFLRKFKMQVSKILHTIHKHTRRSIQPEKYLLEVHKPRIRPGGCQKACSTNIVIELFWEIIKQGITIFSIVSDRK